MEQGLVDQIALGEKADLIAVFCSLFSSIMRGR